MPAKKGNCSSCTRTNEGRVHHPAASFTVQNNGSICSLRFWLNNSNIHKMDIQFSAVHPKKYKLIKDCVDKIYQFHRRRLRFPFLFHGVVGERFVGSYKLL